MEAKLHLERAFAEGFYKAVFPMSPGCILPRSKDQWTIFYPTAAHGLNDARGRPSGSTGQLQSSLGAPDVLAPSPAHSTQPAHPCKTATRIETDTLHECQSFPPSLVQFTPTSTSSCSRAGFKMHSSETYQMVDKNVKSSSAPVGR